MFILTANITLATENRTSLFYARTTFETMPVTENMSVNTVGTEIKNYGGRVARVLNPSEEGKLYILCDISDSMAYELEDYTPVEITVEYYDEGNGFFEIAYDGHRVPIVMDKETNPTSTDRKGIWKNTKLVQLSNSKKWKTYTFYLNDMRMANRADGYDFRIGVWTIGGGFSTESVPIGSVTVKKSTPEKPLQFTGAVSENAGNIFDKTSGIHMSLNYLNASEQQISASFSAMVLNENDEVVWTHGWMESFDGREAKTFSVSPIVNKYGIYRLKILTDTVYTSDNNTVYSDENSTEFSLVWKVNKSDVNDSYGTALLISEYAWAERGKSAKIAADAGAGWNREEIQWSTIETGQKGNYKIPDEMWQDLRNAKNAGLKTELGLIYGNPLYMIEEVNGKKGVPVSEAELKAYGEWCEWLAKETKDYVQAFAIWNEYNVENFNYNYESTENYVKMMRVAYNGVKAGNPDASLMNECVMRYIRTRQARLQRTSLTRYARKSCRNQRN